MAAVSCERGQVGPLAAGAKLGRYEILAKLAAGGMAMVYVARAHGVAGFERLVAIKVLHANLAHEDEFIRMFLDEARLAASIRHPNVVPTIELSPCDEAGYFIVMEYIEGDHLGALLSSAHKGGERLPIPITLRVIADSLGGLGAAHSLVDDTGKSLQLVHRDVSPHNIMVGRDGVARLTDFGVAKAEDRLTHTRDGQVKGKLAYMAPEQAASGRTDARSDLFSVGVILWESLTGQRLFRADNTAATLHKLLHSEISAPSSLDPQLAPLDALLAKALARDPEQRFQSAEQFAQAIEEAAPALGGLSSLRGVARFVKHHTAPKLKREKKLIEDALNSLRSASDQALEDEAPVEVTSPSVSEVSVTGGSLSASKVSGVFSHDTIPGTRRTGATRSRIEEAQAIVLRPMPPPPAGIAATAPIANMSGGYSRADVDLADVLEPVEHRNKRAVVRWVWLGCAAALVVLALWVLRPSAAPARPEEATTLQPAVVQAVATQASPAPAPIPEQPSQHDETSTAAADTTAAMYAKQPAAPSAAARSVRTDKRDDSSARRAARRARRERRIAHSQAQPTRPTKPRAPVDLMPNPYHN